MKDIIYELKTLWILIFVLVGFVLFLRYLAKAGGVARKRTVDVVRKTTLVFGGVCAVLLGFLGVAGVANAGASLGLIPLMAGIGFLIGFVFVLFMIAVSSVSEKNAFLCTARVFPCPSCGNNSNGTWLMGCNSCSAILCESCCPRGDCTKCSQSGTVTRFSRS